MRLSKEKSGAISESVRQAFLELSGGEAREANLRGKKEISRSEILDIIKQKAAASETATRIGAILGCGTKEQIEILSHYGRTYGILMTIRNEFIDVFEPDELKNRFENECLPIPILLAFQNALRKEKILKLLEKEMTPKNIEMILDLSMDSEETRGLIKNMKKWVEKEISLISPLRYCKKELNLLLIATLEDM
jgi:geranylgeranyl diphosphate synthase type I